MGTKHSWISVDGNMANSASWDSGTVPATAATGVLTLSANANNTETVTLDAKTYTFQTVLTDVNGNVLIGATASDSIDNLVAAITLGAGAGTLYAASTTLHPTVTAAAGAGDTMDVTAKKTGTDGNSIATTETMTSGSFGGGTLSGATMWASDDEIVVPSTTLVGMLTNVDWYTNTSPTLRLFKMNVDGPVTPFTKAIGSVANPLRLLLENLNYLGTGELNLDNKLPGGGTSTDIPVYVVASISGVTCAYFDGMVGSIFVKSGFVEVLATATINEDNYTPSIITTLSLSSKIDVLGLDARGAQLVIAQAGVINNARKQPVSEALIVVVSPLGILNQTGIWPLRSNNFIVNDGGQLNYAPVNDPSTYGPILQLLSGRTDFGESVYSLNTLRPVIGPLAKLNDGALEAMTNDPIDLRKDFPL